MPIPTQSLDASFFSGLRTEVQQYFAERKLKQQGPSQMYLKAAGILAGWLAAYFSLLLLGPGNPLIAAVAVCVLTIFTIAIELSIMHDVSHSSLSDRKIVNTCMNVTLTLVGASSILWHHKHVVRHHGHTNVPGQDRDILTGGMFRFRAADEWHPVFRYQHIYAWVLYAFICLEWFWITDLRQTITNLYNLRGKQYAWLWVEVLVAKVCHVLIFMVFPYLFFQSVPVVAVLFLVHWLSFGLFISVVFQLAHVGYLQDFPEQRHTDWAIHQLRTTADFGTSDRFLTWLVGGLNFQVEHHIFPRISHTHYPALQKIVKAYCRRHGVTYHEYPSFWSAVVTHYRYLRDLSAGPVEALEQQAA